MRPKLFAAPDDLELEESGALDDRLRSVGVIDTGQLDDDPFGTHLLNRRLANTELVDPVADGRQRSLDRIGLGLGGERAVWVVDLDGQMHASLEIQAELESRLGLAAGALLRQQGPNAEKQKHPDQDEARSYGSKHPYLISIERLGWWFQGAGR